MKPEEEAVKRAYLEKAIGIRFSSGSKETYPIKCGFCEKEYKIGITITHNNRLELAQYGKIEWHHKDGDRERNVLENVLLLCRSCHKKFHEWGEIQRWLRKIGKAPNDLPDCTKLKRMLKWRY